MCQTKGVERGRKTQSEEKTGRAGEGSHKLPPNNHPPPPPPPPPVMNCTTYRGRRGGGGGEGALKGNLAKGVSPGPSNELQAENHGACVMYWPCCGVGSVCFSAEFERRRRRS